MSSATTTLQLSTGNDLPVSVTLSSQHGTTITGLTITGYLAATVGGAEITSPATALTFTEDTTTPTTARVYRATLDATIVDQLVATGASLYAVAVTIPDDLLIWFRVPVVEHRVGA